MLSFNDVVDRGMKMYQTTMRMRHGVIPLLLLSLAACSNVGDAGSAANDPNSKDNQPEVQTPAWVRLLGSTKNDYGHAMATAPDGSLYIVGQTEGDYENLPNKGDITSLLGNTDILLSKLKSDGSPLWHKILGTSSNDTATSIVIDADGNLIIGGGTLSSLGITKNQGGEDAFVAKLDASGNIIWATAIASEQGERVNDVALDTLGNIYTIGTSFGDIEGATHNGTVSQPDFFVTKLDSDGNKLWTTNHGTTDGDFGNRIAVTSRGEIVVLGGSIYDPDPKVIHGDSNITLGKLDATGETFVWSQQLGSEADDAANAMTVDQDNNIFIGGYINGIAFLDKYDEDGNQLWHDEIDPVTKNNEVRALAIGPDGTILVAGNAVNATFDDLNTAGGGDIFFRRYATNGRPQRTKLYGDEYSDTVQGISVNAQGEIFLCGSSNGAFSDEQPIGMIDVLILGLD